MTIEQAYNDFKTELTKVYDEREADNIADWIFENVTGLKRWERRNNGNEISENHLGKFNEYLKELLKHKPVQYDLNES